MELWAAASRACWRLSRACSRAVTCSSRKATRELSRRRGVLREGDRELFFFLRLLLLVEILDSVWKVSKDWHRIGFRWLSFRHRFVGVL